MPATARPQSRVPLTVMSSTSALAEPNRSSSTPESGLTIRPGHIDANDTHPANPGKWKRSSV
jgi:hypothetical protein